MGRTSGVEGWFSALMDSVERSRVHQESAAGTVALGKSSNSNSGGTVQEKKRER